MKTFKEIKDDAVVLVQAFQEIIAEMKGEVDVQKYMAANAQAAIFMFIDYVNGYEKSITKTDTKES